MKSLLESGDSFEQARSELFRECFVLANTQHKKNKDIYEGGSKLVTLLKVTGEFDFKTELWAAQRAVFEAFLQLVNYGADGKLRDGKIVDFTNRADIIEIGPDENMSDEMISWMGDRAGEDGVYARFRGDFRQSGHWNQSQTLRCDFIRSVPVSSAHAPISEDQSGA